MDWKQGLTAAVVVGLGYLGFQNVTKGAESYDHVATMRALVAWLKENNLEPSDIEGFTPDGEVILKPLSQRANYKEQKGSQKSTRIGRVKSWRGRRKTIMI